MAYLDNSKNIPTSFKSKSRNILRNLALDIYSLNVNPQVFNVPRIQFLYFHHVFNNEEKKLYNVLENLSKHHTFISYSNAVELLNNGIIDKPYLCFSSDDGFKNNLRSAEAFKQFGISCCYFICPSFIGLQNTKEISNNIFHLPEIEFLNWNDIENLQKAGHEIGSHTMNHKRLSKLSNEDIITELEISKNIIHTKTGVNQIHFAYPYGLETDINNFAIEQVRNLGYVSCASAIRGVYSNNTNTNNELIKRDLIIFDWKQSHINYFLSKRIK